MKLLVTGGSGYIGSHTLLSVALAGHTVVVVDNLSNGSVSATRAVESITSTSIELHQFDLRDTVRLQRLFDAESFDACIHLAALKSIPDSLDRPIDYYDNNVGSLLALLGAMRRSDCHGLVFSSSAAVYGYGGMPPLAEGLPVSTTLANPYARSKAMCEAIIRDAAASDMTLSATILRYFNPVGADASGLLGDFRDREGDSLAAHILRVLLTDTTPLTVFGSDYPTADGSAVRDFVHVSDVADGHASALSALRPGASTYNLGTGSGTSVLELVRAFEVASGREVPILQEPRRPGDIAVSYADVTKAEKDLGWVATRTIAEACESAWRWAQRT